MPQKNKGPEVEIQPICMNAFAMRCERTVETERTPESWKALADFFERAARVTERENKRIRTDPAYRARMRQEWIDRQRCER